MAGWYAGRPVTSGWALEKQGALCSIHPFDKSLHLFLPKSDEVILLNARHVVNALEINFIHGILYCRFHTTSTHSRPTSIKIHRRKAAGEACGFNALQVAQSVDATDVMERKEGDIANGGRLASNAQPAIQRTASAALTSV